MNRMMSFKGVFIGDKRLCIKVSDKHPGNIFMAVVDDDEFSQTSIYLKPKDAYSLSMLLLEFWNCSRKKG